MVFKITVNTVCEQILPELDDEFFATFGVNDGGEAKFREDVEKNLEREKNNTAKAKTKNEVMNALLSANDIEVPSALIASEIEELRNQTLQQYGAKPQGLDMRALLPDDMFREQAARRVKLGLLLQEVIASQELKADPEVVRKIIEDTASTYDSPEEVISYYYSNQQLLASVEAAALEDTVVDFLLETAKVNDKKVSYDELLKPLENA